jgi:hypothetical protein
MHRTVLGNVSTLTRTTDTVVDDAAAPATTVEGHGESWQARVALAATLLALLPVVVLLITRLGRDYLPHGDIALIDLRVRDVFSGDVPLLGPYSRYSWNHPGPLYFYLLAPLNGLAGGAAWSTLVGAALLQAVATGLSAWLAWRRGGLRLVLLVLAATALATHAIGPRLLLDAWNPNVAVPFLVLFVLQVWSVTLGDRWQLVGAALVGTFLVQTHVGYAPLVVAGAAFAVIVTVVEQRRTKRAWTPWARPALVAVGAAVVCWIPTLVEQLTNDPGNLDRLYRYARASTDAGVGLTDGAGLLAAELRVPPPWLGGEDLTEVLTNAARPASLWWLAVPIALVVGGALATRRTTASGAARLLALVALLNVVGILALANVEPPTNDYLFYWRVPLATLLVAAAAWPLVGSIPVRATRAVVPGALVVLLAFGAVAQAWDVGDHSGPINPWESTTRTLLRQLDAEEIPDRPFLTRNPGAAHHGVYAAVVDELDRRGHPVRVDPVFDFIFGDGHTASVREVDSVWYIAEEGRDVSLLTDRADARVLARTTPLSRSEERELVALQRSLAAALEGAGRPELVELLEYSFLVQDLRKVPGLDRAAINRVDALNTKVNRSSGSRSAVIAFPAGGDLPAQGFRPDRGVS